MSKRTAGTAAGVQPAAEASTSTGKQPAAEAAPPRPSEADLPEHLVEVLVGLGSQYEAWRGRMASGVHALRALHAELHDALRVDVTPLWGGRVHRALNKRTGRHLIYFNSFHELVNDGTLRSVELGGIDWNWASNQIGHVPRWLFRTCRWS